VIPAGYLLKRVLPPPGWLKPGVSHVTAVCSVADCVNDNVLQPQEKWRHNSFGVSNTAEDLRLLACEEGVETADAQLFYYTAYELELESDGWTFDTEGWRPRSPAPSAAVPDCVNEPSSDALTLLGYDVVVFGDFLEHSPLSCNSIATDVPVNEYCLFNDLAEARSAIDEGKFGGGCEEGLYTIFSVSIVRQ
jgi:hypothetical protein